MATTYDLNTSIGKVRFLVGDTDMANALLTDEEVQQCLSLGYDSLLMGAAFACESLAAKVAGNLTDIGLGSLRINEASKVKALQDQADRFRQKESELPAFAMVEENNCSFTELAIIRNWVQRRLSTDDQGY